MTYRPERPASSPVPEPGITVTGHRHDAAVHGAGVLEHEAAAPAVQRAGDELHRRIRGGTRRRLDAEHVPLTHAGQIAVILLVEEEPAEGAAALGVGRLWIETHVEGSRAR